MHVDSFTPIAGIAEYEPLTGLFSFSCAPWRSGMKKRERFFNNNQRGHRCLSIQRKHRFTGNYRAVSSHNKNTVSKDGVTGSPSSITTILDGSLRRNVLLTRQRNTGAVRSMQAGTPGYLLRKWKETGDGDGTKGGTPAHGCTE